MKKAITYLSKTDPIFKAIIKQYGLPTIPTRPQGFATLALLILEQQVSIDSAKATFGKLLQIVPIFIPANVLDITDEAFRKAGVSRQKTSYIKGLALAIENNEINLHSLAQKPSEKVREQLIALKGIGPWTIDVYLMFCLQAPDILPLGDIAVVNTIKELWSIADKQAMQSFTEQWAPYRSMATFLIWHYYLCKRNRKMP